VHQAFQGEPDDDGSWAAWRLTSGNHRELGRSARVFPDLARAHADADLLRRQIADTRPHILTVPHTTMWGWQLQLDGVAIATSSRGYARHRECAYNAATFIRAVPIAESPRGVLSRSWPCG
jgi:hypothetical protein